MVGGGGLLFWKLTLLLLSLVVVNLVQILEGLTLQIFVSVYVLFYFYICVVDLT